MDVSAQATMKDAAKCDKHCEWQISVNQQNAQRILHFQIFSESISGSGPLAYHVANDATDSAVSWYTFLFASDDALLGVHIRWRMKQRLVCEKFTAFAACTWVYHIRQIPSACL